MQRQRIGHLILNFSTTTDGEVTVWANYLKTHRECLINIYLNKLTNLTPSKWIAVSNNIFNSWSILMTDRYAEFDHPFSYWLIYHWCLYLPSMRSIKQYLRLRFTAIYIILRYETCNAINDDWFWTFSSLLNVEYHLIFENKHSSETCLYSIILLTFLLVDVCYSLSSHSMNKVL